MSTTIDTFIYLQRDIEHSFQRLDHSTFRNQSEFEQLVNHLRCTLDDLEQVNRLISSSNDERFQHLLPNPTTTTRINEQTEVLMSPHSNIVEFSKIDDSNSNERTNCLPTREQREDFIRRMKKKLEISQDKSWIKSTAMETIRLDPVADDENDDQRILREDKHLDDIHHSIVSLKNLTRNINAEIDDHIRVLDDLDSNMINSQRRVEHITRQTQNFFLSSDGVGGHTCLFAIAVCLFFLIVVLILFF